MFLKAQLIAILCVAAFGIGSSLKPINAHAQQHHDHELDVADDGEKPRDPKRLWCNEHSRYEDECYICHPELKKSKTDANEAPAVHNNDGSKPCCASDAKKPRDPKRLWCGEHSRYEDECYICHPELKKSKTDADGDHAGHDHDRGEHGGAIDAKKQRDPKRLWCNEHSRYEDECYICHPELKKSKTDADGDHAGHDHDQGEHRGANDAKKPRDPKRLWCKAHSRYEDECYICHPELKDQKTEAAGSHAGHDHGGGAHGGLWCNEHRVAEIECGICQPQLAGSLSPGSSLKVRLPSAASASMAGISSVRPRIMETAASIKLYCEVRYNQNRLARVTPLVAGVIHNVRADIGDVVSKGDLLIEIASTEVADAKRDLLGAIVGERVKQFAFDREKRLAEKQISAAQHLQQAEAEYLMSQLATTSARQRLMNFGFTEQEVREVEETKSSTSIVHVHAPFSGTLVERSAVMGEAVKPGVPLYTLADLGSMWLNLSIPEGKLTPLRVGLDVEATFAALPGVKAKGKISWISTTVSEPSRMVEARAVVPNVAGLLRNNLFGEARIILSTEAQALTVPIDAVQRIENRPFVFVKLEEDLYGLRRVDVGIKEYNRIQITAGLSPTESVVVIGGSTMLSEFLKSRLGAGCVHE